MRISKIVFLILLPLLLTGLFAARFFLLEQIAIYALHRAGADSIELHISDVGLNQAHIDYLTARFNPAGNMRLPVDLRDISIHYNLPGLLTTARCDTIVIKTMDLKLDDKSTRPKTPLHLPESIRLLNDELRKRLPITELQIQQLNLHNGLPAQLSNQSLQVRASHKDITISATIILQINPETSVTLDLHSPESARSTIRVLGRRQDRTFFQADLSLFQPKNQDPTFTINVGATQLTLADIQASAVKLQAAGTISDNTTFRLAQNSRFRISSLGRESTTIDEFALDIAGTYRISPDGLTCSLAQKDHLQIKGVTTGELHLAGLEMQAEHGLQLTIQDNSWSVAENSLNIAPLQFKEGTRRYDTGSLVCRIFSLHGQQTNFSLSARITTPTLVLTGNRKELPLKQLAATLHLTDRQLQAGLEFSPARIPGRIRGKIFHDFTTAAGSLRLQTNTPFNLNREGMTLSHLFTPWPYPFNLDKGTLAGTAESTWTPEKKTQLAVSLTLQQSGGFYKHFLFNGLDLYQDLAILPRLHSKTAGPLYLAHLVGALNLTELSTKIEFLPSKNGKLPEIRLTDFRTELFDGSITSPAIQYDLNAPNSSFAVNIKKINLAPLIKLLHQDDLQVTGSLSGTIPIRIMNKNVFVKNGELHNEPPGGEIRYTPENMNQQGIAGYALKAVEDFRYDSLRATANYAPSGQLDFDIHLQGISPLLDANRPLHLNIHAEQNLPDLLQSLRFSKGLIEQLDKRIHQQYK